MAPAELGEYLSDALDSPTKKFTFINKNLRSASDIFKKGGHVTAVFKDQSFSLLYDNKREIKDEIVLTPSLKDSVPITNATQALIFRTLSQTAGKNSYHKTLPRGSVKKYKNTLEIGVRNFIKGLFSNQFNLNPETFKNYNEIISFINSFKGSSKYRLTANNIATLKRRRDSIKKVPRTKELELFCEYVKTKFPDFDVNRFLGK